MSAEKTYVRAVDKSLGYLAAWLPTTDIHLGDIGRFDGATFVPNSSLGARGISLKKDRDSTTGDQVMQVGRGFKMTTKAKGSTLDIAPSIPRAKLGVVLEFSSKSAAVLSATGCVEDRLADEEGLRNRIMWLYDNGQWDPDLVVVTHVVRAKKTTILVSEEGASKFELTASAKVKAANVEIADISAGFTLTSSYNGAYSFVGRSGLTPLFRAVKVQGFWFPDVDRVHPERPFLDFAIAADERKYMVRDPSGGMPRERYRPATAPASWNPSTFKLTSVKVASLLR